MIYNVSFDICAGVITLLALGGMLLGRDMERRANRTFFAMIVMHLISIIFDILSSVCNSDPASFSVMLRDFTNYIFLSVHTSEAAVFFCFLLEQLGLNGRLRAWQRFALLLPEFLMVLLPLALNPIFRGVFTYDLNDMYVHGPAMPLIYAAADIYMAACIIIVVKCRSRLSSFQRFSAIMLLLLSVVPMLIQSIFMPHQLIEMFFQAIGFCGYLQSVENIDESRNPVTHAWNRHVLIRDFMKTALNDVCMSVVIVKLSQTQTLKISSEGSGRFHHIRMIVAEWFGRSSAKPGMKFYDCEKGIYAAAAFGPDAEYVCREFARKADERFREPWGTDDARVTFPVQILTVSFPDPQITVHDFFYIITQPYFATEDEITYAEASQLLSRYHDFEEVSEQTAAIPPELKSSMDDFLSRIGDLTPAEKKVFDLYVEGCEVGEIPEKAFISINTVKKHNKNIYRKLGVSSREEIRLYVDLFCRCGRDAELRGGT